jgi:SAM-dependent methyltransferase
MNSAASSFEDLIRDAERAPFEGWDFSFVDGRMVEDPLPWDYAAEVRRRIAGVKSMLDLGTGGGEVLSQLAPLPALTVATEAYAPNALVAGRRLNPLGARVIQVEGAPENYATLDAPLTDAPRLPIRDCAFELVINRHESYLAAEVFRVLRPGGTFLTQQCGGKNYGGLNDLLGLAPLRFQGWELASAIRQVQAAGFEVLEAREQFTDARFHDVGAIVYFLKAAPWQAPDFEVVKSRKRLAELYPRIRREGPVTVQGHHFVIEARRPA